MAESLESRMVLSVAPVDETVGPSLAEYLAQEHEMGPVAPAEFASSDTNSADDAAAQNQSAFLSQAEGGIDNVAEGEGGGEGSASGQGSGGGSASGSGSSGGQGSGSGAGSGSGQGSGSGGGSEDPTISDVATEQNNDGTFTVSGTVSDDGDTSDLTIALSGVSGDVTINPDGTFSINIADSNGQSSFDVNVTDANGNTTTYTFDFPI